MPRLKTRAIIINTKEYSESDKIIVMLSQYRGLINAIAKGAQRSMKRFPGTLEPFNEIEAELFIKPGNELFRLEEAKLINANLGIRNDLLIYAHASILLELLLLNLAPSDPHTDTFDILKNSLSMLVPGKQWFCHWASALLGILKTIGYGIDINEVSKLENSIQTDKISIEALRFIERFCTPDFELLSRVQLSENARNELVIWLTNYCEKITGRPFRTISLLKSLI